MAKKEPLYPHTPKRKKPLFPHVSENQQSVEIPLTPKQVDIVHWRFFDVGYEWVTFKTTDIPFKGNTLIIPKDRLDEALGILDSAVDRTRDWVYEPIGRAEHYSTVNLYEKVKAAKERLLQTGMQKQLYPHVTRGQKPQNKPAISNVEVYASSEIPRDIAEASGLHRDPKVEYRYLTYYYGPDLNLFQRDLQRLLRERTGIPMLVVVAYYLGDSPQINLDLLAKTEGDPISKYCCSQCGECAPEELLEEGRFLDRISWLRRHYKERHPGMWGHVGQMPATIPSGSCYEDAWRFLIKEEEGELVHGSVQTIGKRIDHAWVELPTGYIWEPESAEFMKKEHFYERARPEVHGRYTTEQAAIMAARTGNLGPWTANERGMFLLPQTLSPEHRQLLDLVDEPLPKDAY